MTKKFFSIEEKEHLDGSIKEAVQSYIDNVGGLTSDDFVAVQVYKSIVMNIDPMFELERIIEELDDEYGNSPYINFEATQKMKDAATAYYKVITQEYRVRMSQKIGTIRVRVGDYIEGDK